MISKPIQTASMTVADISDLCAHTRSELVQWDYRSQTDVSECWSRRWVVQWALSDNSWETKIIFYCFKSENIHNRMLLEQWKKLLFYEDTECCSQNPLYRTDSVYTWLNNDWTLKRNVTDALLSQQFFWPEMLQNVCTFCWNATNAVWTTAEKTVTRLLEALSVLKWIWQKIFIDFVVNLLSSEGCTNLLIIMNCLSKKIILKLCKNMTAEWVTQTFTTFLSSSWAFHHNSLRLRHSVCEQFMKESLSTFKDCTKVFTAYHSKLTE
jgi:hypothetical protein